MFLKDVIFCGFAFVYIVAKFILKHKRQLRFYTFLRLIPLESPSRKSCKTKGRGGTESGRHIQLPALTLISAVWCIPYLIPSQVRPAPPSRASQPPPLLYVIVALSAPLFPLSRHYLDVFSPSNRSAAPLTPVILPPAPLPLIRRLPHLHFLLHLFLLLPGDLGTQERGEDLRTLKGYTSTAQVSGGTSAGKFPLSSFKRYAFRCAHGHLCLCACLFICLCVSDYMVFFSRRLQCQVKW